MNKRNITIDFLRVAGLLCIILAHVSPPEIIFQIRNFDVPLMVMVSGILFSLTNKDEQMFRPLDYVKKRFVRLVIPVWLFLTAFFLINYSEALFFHLPFIYNLNQIMTSYLLWDGIGYVWIIRVFLLLALFAPYFIKKFAIKSKPYLIFVVVFVYEIVVLKINTLIPNALLNNLITGTVLYLFGFFIFFSYGVIIKDLRKRTIFMLSFVSLVFTACGFIYTFIVHGKILDLQSFKYPPSLFYITYAIGVLSMLFLLKAKFEETLSLPIQNIISFVGSATIWIYLWHILWIEIVNRFFSSMNFGLKYVFVVLLAILMTFIQRKIVLFLINRSKVSTFEKKMTVIIFCS